MKAALFVLSFIAAWMLVVYGCLLQWFAPYMVHVHLLSSTTT